MNQSMTITLRAAAATDLSAATNLGLGAAQDTDGRIVLAGANGRNGVGVITDTPRAAGQPVTLAVLGTVRARAGGALDEGDWVTTEAGGGFVIADEGDDVWGRCIQRGGAADGDLFDLLLVPSGGSTAPQP